LLGALLVTVSAEATFCAATAGENRQPFVNTEAGFENEQLVVGNFLSLICIFIDDFDIQVFIDAFLLFTEKEH